MILDNTIHLLDYGHVRLDGHCANDLSVVNAARVSFAQHSDSMGDREVGLINFLMRNRHGTPFEHNFFKFSIRCPLFVRSEWMRHRIASYNEESARYSRIRLDAYVAQGEDVRKQIGKPGAYRFEPLDDPTASVAQGMIEDAYDKCFETYEALLELGVAKEVARAVLPEGRYTEFYFSTNARSLMNFIGLRNSDHALREIKYYAEALEQYFALLMPVTYQAFLDNERVAP